MDEKKKRGSNYTPAEKDMLLELIKKYQHIIENKETNANIITKKREAWDSVCQQYNAVAVSGCRTWQQLRHLYENLKQRSKKNIAKANRLQYYDNTIEVKKKASHDKKEINRTGGGAYKSVITEQDAQILAMVAPQIQPLANSFDDAATYFRDREAKTQKTESRVTSPELIYTYKIDDQDITMADSSKSCTSINILSDDQGAATAIKPTEKNKPQPSTSASATATEIIPIEKSKPPPSTYARKVKPKSMSIKEQYFKTKLRNAKLENKYLINKHKMEIKKYKLEIQILKLRLQKFKKF